MTRRPPGPETVMPCWRAAGQGQPASWVWAGLVGCPARLWNAPHTEGSWLRTSAPGVQWPGRWEPSWLWALSAVGCHGRAVPSVVEGPRFPRAEVATSGGSGESAAALLPGVGAAPLARNPLPPSLSPCCPCLARTCLPTPPSRENRVEAHLHLVGWEGRRAAPRAPSLHMTGSVQSPPC